MTWIVAAVTAALVFGILDAAWLGWAGSNFYRPQLGGLLAESFRMVPALLFYCAYICAIVWFAVRPGLAGGIGTAALNGALLGAICYATYDLTNQATMRNWSTIVTLVDICWGAFATAVAAGAATFVADRFG